MTSDNEPNTPASTRVVSADVTSDYAARTKSRRAPRRRVRIHALVGASLVMVAASIRGTAQKRSAPNSATSRVRRSSAGAGALLLLATMLTILMSPYSATAASVSWQLMPGRATDIAGSAGGVWMIGTNPVPGGYGIYRWDTNRWTQVPGGAVRIAVDRNGTPYVVNDQGLVFTRSGDQWWQYPANVTRARDVAVTEDGNVYIVGTASRPGGYAIYRFIPPEIANWSEVGGGGVRIGGGRAPWLVNNNGRVFTSDTRGWYALPGTARDVAADGNTGWIIGTTPVPGGYTIHRFDGVDFDRVSGGATAITVGPSGQPWIVNSFGEVFRGNAFPDQRQCPLSAVDVPESATSVTAATLMPGESVKVSPDAASRIWAGVWLTGENGPEGWNTTAPTGYPLPGQREYSLLVNAGSGWQYLGSMQKTVQNRTGDPQPLRFRTNDNWPGNGSGKFIVALTFTCRD